MKDDLSQKIHGNMMFSLHSAKVVFLFPTNMKLPFCQKSKGYLLPKNTYKHGIPGITKKGETHPRKDDIGILDQHSRKGSSDSMYFYGYLFRCFHIFLSNEKTRKFNV